MGRLKKFGIIPVINEDDDKDIVNRSVNRRSPTSWLKALEMLQTSRSWRINIDQIHLGCFFYPALGWGVNQRMHRNKKVHFHLE